MNIYIRLGMFVLMVAGNSSYGMLTKTAALGRVMKKSAVCRRKSPDLIGKRKMFTAITPVVIINQKECMVIERFGKFNRTLHPGIHFKIPFIEDALKDGWLNSGTRIDLRERVHDLPKQKVITGDNVEMTIGGIVYYKIDQHEPEKAVYEISDLPYSLEKLAQTTLRNIIGSMQFDQTLTARDQINKTLSNTLDGATDKWGVTVTRVELQEITPPHEILNAMEKQMVAERVRRAVVTEAEGKREAAIKQAEGEREAAIKRAEAKKMSAILEAEGAAMALAKTAEAQKMASILQAEGDAQAKRERAKAEADALEFMQDIVSENAPEYLTKIEYIRNLPKMTEGKDNKLIILPADLGPVASLVSAAKGFIEGK